MTSLAHRSGVFGDPTERWSSTATKRTTRLRLVQSGDGWSLVDPEGELVFRALGTNARRRCLEFARARGVLAVFS
jgi:hypothetical protein